MKTAVQLWSQHEAETTTVCSERIKKKRLISSVTMDVIYLTAHTQKKAFHLKQCVISSHHLIGCVPAVRTFTNLRSHSLRLPVHTLFCCFSDV